MKTDKVAHRKNKSRKQKAPGQSTSSPQHSEVRFISFSPPSAASSSDTREEAGLDTRLVEVTDTDTDLNRIDIGDIAERCVLEELSGHVTVEEVNLDSLNIDPAAETSTVFQITPSLKLTIEEEYKICELEASKVDMQAMFDNA